MAEELFTPATARDNHGNPNVLVSRALQENAQNEERKTCRGPSSSVSPHRSAKAIEVHDATGMPRHKRQYQQRRAGGLCTRTGCPTKAERGYRHCRNHLEKMAKSNKRRAKARKRKGLCVYCGARPQFWGVRCIICRQRFAKNPLPAGARRALRLYREAEKQFEIEMIQVRARFDVRKLIANGKVEGDRARALRLYAGLDKVCWRTYSEVGDLMSLSKERVRQLLESSKTALAAGPGSSVPWKQF